MPSNQSDAPTDAPKALAEWSEIVLDRLQSFSTPGLVTADMDLARLSPAALAYLGDAVYELFIRSQYLIPPKRLNLYHKQVVDQVRAESQVYRLQALEPYLTHEELDVIRRGRNSTSRGPRRVALDVYQQASGFETLLGYLYLTDMPRLLHLLDQLQLNSVKEQGTPQPC